MSVLRSFDVLLKAFPGLINFDSRVPAPSLAKRIFNHVEILIDSREDKNVTLDPLGPFKKYVFVQTINLNIHFP